MTKEDGISLKQHPLWEKACAEIDRKIEISQKSLETCNKETVLMYQQRIKALRDLKRLPEDVINRDSE